MQIHEQDAFIKSLDDIGEEAVKRNLARGVWNPQKVMMAELWLGDREQERSDRSQAASLRIARSAKNAAWAAAIAAIIAIPIAIAAMVISYLAWTSPHPPH